MFKFRLQRVLDLRERKERDAATALVSAEEAADDARQASARLELARQELAARRAPRAPAAGAIAPSVGELRNLGFLLERLDEHVAVAQTAAAAAAAAVEERRGELQVAFRDRRTLDRLKERHLEGYRSAEAAADRQLMDEIALTRFTQGSTPAGAPAHTTPDET